MVTLEDVKNNPLVESFIRKGDEYLGVMGFTEHGFRHVNLVSTTAGNTLKRLGYPARDAELASIAGYMHDIGNVVSRKEHGLSGAKISFDILNSMGMPPDEIATVISSIANHEEEYGHAINPVAAALIVADKSDVHRTRVRNRDLVTFDIHDRVNFAAEHSFLWVQEGQKTITMELTIDTKICPVMEYFEIFLTRMMLCRRAATFLECDFQLVVNGAKLL